MNELDFDFTLEPARPADADQLLKLYYLTYGRDYPLTFGTDRETMLRTMASPEFLWIVARAAGGEQIAGSVVVDLDNVSRIGKLTGLVVHPEFRRHQLGNRLVNEATARVLAPRGSLNSVYATTRTNSISPQLACIRDGYIPLGIFPNAHKLKDYETLTLLAKFAPGVLNRRAPVAQTPYELGGLLAVLERQYGLRTETRVGTAQERKERAYQSSRSAANAASSAPLEFELVFAPQYVRRVFNQKMSDPYDRFYPFHVPNLMMASTNGEAEMYAYFSKKDRYCAIVSQNLPMHQLRGRLGGLLNQLKDEGVSYLEILLDMQYTQSIEAALDEGFVPSAFYPAMREINGRTYDFVILSRTMEPLNFKGMTIERSFKPFVDEYVRLWTETHLLSLEVYDVH